MAKMLSDKLHQQVVAVIRDWLSRNISQYIRPQFQRDNETTRHLAKSTSGISKGSTGNMTVYFRDSSGTPQISSPAITLENVMAEMGSYAANKLAYVEQSGGRWVIYQTECAS